MHALHALLHLLDGRAEIGALEAPCYGDETLQILAQNLVLWWKLRDGGHRAERGRMAGAGVEDRVADGLERLACLVAETNADGVRTAVADERRGRFDTIEDGGCV